MEAQPVEKYVNGKKMLLFKTKAYFLMSVEKNCQPNSIPNKSLS
jgi:hypothetical protein